MPLVQQRDIQSPASGRADRRERVPGWEPASLTLEAAAVMSVVIFTLLMAVYLTAHIHNRAYLTAGAAEQAISGHVQKDPQLFAAGDISVTRTDTKTARTVESTAGTVHFSGEVLWGIRVKQTFRKYQPAKLIRLMKAASELADGG